MTGGPLEIHTFVLGPLATNTYLLNSGNDCWVLDPGMQAEPLIRLCTQEQLSPQVALLTHGHCDHVAGLNELKRVWPKLRVLCPQADADMLGDAQKNMSAPFGMPMTFSPAATCGTTA